MADSQHAIANDLYLQVGKALSAWGELQETLCTIYALTVVNDLSDPIGRATSAFWAIESFRGKLSMTNAAIQFRFSSQEPILQKWKPLHEGLSKRWKKRNEIAHGTVVKWQFPDPKTKNPTTETFFVPSLYKQVNTLSATLLEWSKDQSTRSIFVPKHVSIETRSKIAAKASTSSMIG